MCAVRGGDRTCRVITDTLKHSGVTGTARGESPCVRSEWQSSWHFQSAGFSPRRIHFRVHLPPAQMDLRKPEWALGHTHLHVPEYAGGRERGMQREAGGNWENGTGSPQSRLKEPRGKGKIDPHWEASGKVPESRRQRKGLRGERRLPSAWTAIRLAALTEPTSARGEPG